MKTTRKQRRSPVKTGLDLSYVEPLTRSQLLAFESESNMVLHGWAGTGKTYCATYLGLDDIINKRLYSRLIFIRSTVSVRNQGFLPGTEKEKCEVYESPYREIVGELFSRSDAYDTLKLRGIIQFMATSYIRGTNLNDAVVVVDETQNMTYQELDTIITRIGKNCRIIFCGDYRQADHMGSNQKTGITEFNKVLRAMNEFDFIDFTKDDIVRSPLVKSYLVAKDELFGDRQLS